jgi:hypothetical protein
VLEDLQITRGGHFFEQGRLKRWKNELNWIHLKDDPCNPNRISSRKQHQKTSENKRNTAQSENKTASKDVKARFETGSMCLASTCQHLSGPHLCHDPLLPLNVFHVYRPQDLRDTWHVFVLYPDAKGLPVDQIVLERLCDIVLQKKVPFQSASFVRSSHDVISN